MNIEVGSYEAKTKLPELLRGIQAGLRYTITLRGVAVADLLPTHVDQRVDSLAAADDLLAFMEAHRSVGKFNLKALIDEGRS